MGFEPLVNDPCVFKQSFDGLWYFVALYVDDLIHISPNSQLSRYVADLLTVRYGEMDHHFESNLSFLSLNIRYDIIDGSLFMDQNSYIEKFLELVASEYEISPQIYPSIDELLYKDELDNNKSYVDADKSLKYRSYLMTIMYVALRTRPDVLFAIGFLSSWMAKPPMEAWNSLFKVIGYLKANPSMQITYRKCGATGGGSNNLFLDQLEIYVDASWCLDSTARGQSGMVLKLNGNTIFFRTSKQNIVTKSSTESEIVAVDEYLPYALWTLSLCEELNLNVTKPILVYQDNQSGVKIMEKGHGNFKRTKHFINKYYWIKQYVDNGTIEFRYLITTKMIADIFTKPIVGHLFYLLLYFIFNPYHVGGRN
jgi:hypothetical protein